jgi:hypothetical protein
MSSAQAITAIGSTVSTDVIDLNNFRDLSIGDPHVDVLCRVTTLFTSGGAATLQAQVQGSTDNATFFTMAESIAYALAALTAGADLLRFSLPGPAAGQAMPRYLRMNYVIATAVMTGGAVESRLILDRHRVFAYPPGIAIVN